MVFATANFPSSVVFESEQEHHTYSMAKKSADYLTIAELCESDWWSRMKANSGSFWMEKDPWWRGNTPRLTRYCREGTYHTYFFQDHPLTTRLGGFGRFKTRVLATIYDMLAYKHAAAFIPVLHTALCTVLPYIVRIHHCIN